MRTRPLLRRTAFSALAAGLAAAGTLALASPAPAAEQNVTATLRVKIAEGNSVYTQINGSYTCHENFTVGKAKDIKVTVPAGQWIQVFNSHDCYDSISIGGTRVDTDGQVIDIAL
ncbi:hypothetical protein ABZ078_15320 [Streptomyces sp. NPDC006385]|uniref:hypothetical protein n=1 Tax=Streptomyces sp. NPDC006385 TaxID=3156761 RepID=UPI0033BC7B3E